MVLMDADTERWYCYRDDELYYAKENRWAEASYPSPAVEDPRLKKARRVCAVAFVALFLAVTYVGATTASLPVRPFWYQAFDIGYIIPLAAIFYAYSYYKRRIEGEPDHSAKTVEPERMGRTGSLMRELFYGEVRAAIQIGAGVIGLLMWDAYRFGNVAALLVIFPVIFGLEFVRSRRFRQLYAERRRLAQERGFVKGFLIAILGIVAFVFLFPLAYFTGTNYGKLVYVLLIIWGLWSEIWLAYRRYGTD